MSNDQNEAGLGESKKKPTVNQEADFEIAKRITQEASFESDAQKACALLKEYGTWTAKVQDFIKTTGNNPQEPVNFLRNVLLTYGIKKAESKIIVV